MREATTFLRYVFPGLISIGEFFGYLLISGDLCLCQLGELAKDTGLPIPAGAFLASAALGFLWQLIYYQIEDYWETLKIDYSIPFKEAQKRKWVTLECYEQLQELQGMSLKRKGAWRVGTSYFSMNAEVSKRMKGVDLRMNRFADLVHGLGTTFVGSFVALVFFLGINISHAWSGKISFYPSLSFMVGLGILCLVRCNFRRVKKHCEIVYGMILLKEFEIEFKERKEPIRFYVFQDDLV